jgi:hypothetical protein
MKNESCIMIRGCLKVYSSQHHKKVRISSESTHSASALGLDLVETVPPETIALICYSRQLQA